MAQAIMRIPPIFMDLIESPQYRYKCYYGGRGGGKSESIGRALLILASKSKKRILCTREVQNSIKDSVYKLLVDLIKLYKLPCFTITQETIKHLNGSEFIFKGLYNNTDSLKSLHDIDIAWVEAPQQIIFSESQYNSVFEKAAVYLRNIVGDHPFFDGNKRTGVSVCAIYLLRNGRSLKASPIELEKFTIDVGFTLIKRKFYVNRKLQPRRK